MSCGLDTSNERPEGRGFSHLAGCLLEHTPQASGLLGLSGPWRPGAPPYSGLRWLSPPLRGGRRGRTFRPCAGGPERPGRPETRPTGGKVTGSKQTGRPTAGGQEARISHQPQPLDLASGRLVTLPLASWGLAVRHLGVLGARHLGLFDRRTQTPPPGASQGTQGGPNWLARVLSRTACHLESCPLEIKSFGLRSA